MTNPMPTPGTSSSSRTGGASPHVSPLPGQAPTGSDYGREDHNNNNNNGFEPTVSLADPVPLIRSLRSPCTSEGDQPSSRTGLGRVRFTDEMANKLAAHWGEGDDGYFACPIPGHDDRARMDSEGDEWWLGCCRNRRRSLGDVRASIGYGRDSGQTDPRYNIELATWWRRLAWELDGFAPVDVQLPELPPQAPVTVSRLREGFGLLVGLRWADYEPRPVAFSVRFAAAWCGDLTGPGLTHRQSAEGIRVLREHGVILGSGRSGRTPLYLPGALAEVSC